MEHVLSEISVSSSDKSQAETCFDQLQSVTF